MRIVRFIFCVFLFIFTHNAYARCENPRLITPEMPGNPGVVPIGAVTFKCDEITDPPDITFDEWYWEFDGQRVTNASSFTINASTTGAKIVKFHFELCNAAGCGGGTYFPTALVGIKPSISLSNPGVCTLQPVPGFPGNRNAFFEATRSTNDPNPNTRLVAIQFKTASGPGSFRDYSLTQGTYNAKTKGSSVGRGTITSIVNYIDANGSPRAFSILSDSQEITVTCPNLPPIMYSVGGDEIMNVGSTRGFTPVVEELDGDSLSEYKYVVTRKPAGSSVPNEVSLVVPPVNQSLLFTPDKPGEYVLAVTAKDIEGSESAPMVKTMTVLPLTLPLPKFKVRLSESGVPVEQQKEYLFDDCAPFNDPCKLKAATHKAGEFLLDDEITLDASDANNGTGNQYNWTITGPGSANGDPNSCLTLAPTSANKITCRLPAAGFGDYQIELKLSKNGVFSEPTRKLARVEESIEIAFQNLDQPLTPARPYPVFNQGYFSDFTLGNGTRSMQTYGCGLMALATMGQLRGQTLQGQPLTPPVLNDYLISPGPQAFLGSNIQWNSAVPFLNGIVPSENGGAIFSYPGSNPMEQGLPFFSKTPNQLKHLARKRAIALLWVHSLKHDRADLIDNHQDEKWARECRNANPPILDSEKCHKTHKHYVVLKGLRWDAASGSPHVMIHDPGNRNVDDLDASFGGDPLGYGGHLYGAMVLAPTSLSPQPRGALTLGQLSITVEGLVSYNVMDSLGRQVGLVSGRTRSTIPGATQGVDGLANDEEGSSGESSASWTTTFIPGESFVPGRYTITWPEQNQSAIRGSATVLNSDGGFIRTISFQGAGGSVSFDITQDLAINGALSISDMRLLTSKPKFADEEVLYGTLQAGPGSNGWNPSNESVSIMIHGQGDFLPAGSFIQLPTGDWAYHKPDRVSGIYEMRITPAGNFSIKARKLGDLNFKPGSQATLKISIGDDDFSGSFTIANNLPRAFLRIIPDKILYARGDVANVRVKLERGTTDSEKEIVPELRIGSEIIYSREEGVDEYSYLLPALSSGVIDLKAQAYVQDKRLGRGFKEALKILRSEKAEIEAKLEDGVDSIQRKELEERLQRVNDRIAIIREELSRIRTPVGTEEEMRVYVD